MENETRLSLLHYYNGEPANPFNDGDAKSMYWMLEYLWHSQVVDREEISSDYMNEFAWDFPDLCDNITKETPISLKAFMYNRYYNFAGSKLGFESWLMNYVENAIR